MAILLGPVGATGEAATIGLFGGNVLADRGDMTGHSSYAEAIDAMNVHGIRYPGGALTEYTFDIANPDAPKTTDMRDGEITDFIPLSDAMAFAAAGGHAITIVLPTRTNLSETTDANGDRLSDVDADVLRDFIHDVTTGVYGDARIAAFEIGNEYWNSGEMNATEYGRVSSEMGKIIHDELNLVEDVYGIDTSQLDIVFQMGTNYGSSNLKEAYDNWDAPDVIADLQARHPGADIDDRFIWAGGGIDFAGINNQLILAEFDEGEIEAVDGIVAHVYSDGEDNPDSRTWDLRIIEDNWLDEPGFEDLKLYVTEWNQKSVAVPDKSEGYGLSQAHEMLNLTEEFMAHGVDVAHVWPLIQNTANSLSSGFEFEEMSVPGHMFAMMSETLPGKRMIDFSAKNPQTDHETAAADIHGFAGENELVLYIASNSDKTETTEIAMSSLVAEFGMIDATVLGVARGEMPDGTRAKAEIEDLKQSDFYENGVLTATLDPGEIMQIVFTDVVPTDAFADAFNAANQGGMNTLVHSDDNVDGLETLVDDDQESRETEDRDEDVSGDDVLGGLEWAMMLLPLLALAGLGG